MCGMWMWHLWLWGLRSTEWGTDKWERAVWREDSWLMQIVKWRFLYFKDLVWGKKKINYGRQINCTTDSNPAFSALHYCHWLNKQERNLTFRGDWIGVSPVLIGCGQHVLVDLRILLTGHRSSRRRQHENVNIFAVHSDILLVLTGLFSAPVPSLLTMLWGCSRPLWGAGVGVFSLHGGGFKSL